MTSPAKAWEVEKQQPYEGMLPDNSQILNTWIQSMRQWELKQQMNDPEFDINNALADYFNGEDGATEQEELLQFQSNRD